MEIEIHTKEIEYLLEHAYSLRVSNLAESLELAEKALNLSKDSNNKGLIAKSLSSLSLFHMIKGEYDKTLLQANNAITYFEELGDELGIANAKYNIAGVYYKTDNFHLGLVYLLDCLQIFKKFDDQHNLARTLKSMGTIYDFFGDTNNSISTYESAIEAAQKAKDLNLESNVFNPLSGLYLKQGNIEKAQDLINRAIEMKNQTGDIRGLAFSIYGRGKIKAFLKDYEQAENDYREAIEIHEKMGERLGVGMAFYKLAILRFAKGKTEDAKELLYKTLEYCENYNIVYIKIKANYSLYEIYKKENEFIKALEILEKYLQVKESVINTQTMMVIRNYEMITRIQKIEKEAEMEREKALLEEKHSIAEHKAKLKQDFLSTMSHEIRTPLNAIISIASLLDEKRFDKEDLKLFQSMKFASSNLLMLINDILDFTKLDSGKIILDLQHSSLKKFIHELCNTYQSMAHEKGLSLELMINPAIAPFYKLDTTKLGQILGNLITNAIKYTEIGFVKVSVDLLGHSENKDLIEFRVTDSGMGIPIENQELVFESFYQPTTVSTRKQGGSGLGLAIVKNLVNLHNSQIHITSSPGEGSSFYFELDLEPSFEIKQISGNTSSELNNKTTLIVEDNMVNAMVSKKMLGNWGISSDHATNGFEAVHMANQKKYDFILMDIHMPGMNGFEAAKIIRESDNLNKYTSIFALTADITFDKEIDNNEYFSGILPKPVEMDKLFNAFIQMNK